MRTITLVPATLLLLGATTHGQTLLVVERNFKTVVEVSAVDGSVVNGVLVNLNLSQGKKPKAPYQAIDVGGEIWITDPEAGVVFRFSREGEPLRQIDSEIEHPRGIARVGANAWVANAAAAGPAEELVVFDREGERVAVHAIGAHADAYGVLAHWGQVLVTDVAGHDLELFDLAGDWVTTRHDSDGVDGIDSPRQVSRRTGGNLLVAGHDSPSGIYEFDPLGAPVAYYDTEALGFGGVEGVHELKNGNLLFTNGDGLHVYDPVMGTVTTELAGLDAGFVTARPVPTPPRTTQILSAAGIGNGDDVGGASDIAVAGDGTAYVAGYWSESLYRISPGGLVSKVVDGSWFLGHAIDVAMDDEDRAYVVGDRLLRVDPDGAVTLLLDHTGDGQGHAFSGGNSVATDSLGNAYAGGALSANVFRIDAKGSATEILDASGDGAGHPFGYPTGLAADDAGTVFVTDGGNHQVFRVTAAGTIEQILDATGDGGANPLQYPVAPVVHRPTGDLFVCGVVSRNVFRITPAGTVSVVLDPQGDGNGNTVVYPTCLAVDADGTLYVGDSASSGGAQIFRVSPDGVVELLHDHVSDPWGNESSGLTWGLDLSDDGDLFLAIWSPGTAFRIGGPVTLGLKYCGPAQVNSGGGSGDITAAGSDAVATGVLSLRASDLPKQQFGYFLASLTSGALPYPGGSQGRLCLGGTIGRFVNDVQSSGTLGAFAIDVDLGDLPAPLDQVLPGETWFFQAWYRDKNPTSTSNFTDGVSVLFH